VCYVGFMADSNELRAYSVAETAELLSLTPRTIYAWIKERKLVAYEISRRGLHPQYRISAQSIQAFLDARKLK
jgi:excisionase family DNA binding protein